MSFKDCTIIIGFNYEGFSYEEVDEIEGEGDVYWKGDVYVFGSLCVRGFVFFDGVALETDTINNHEYFKERNGMKCLEGDSNGGNVLDENIDCGSYRDLLSEFVEMREKPLKKKPLIYKDRRTTIINGDLYIHKKTKIHTVAFAD